MSKGGGSAPPAIDPTALGNAQTQSNITTAQNQAKLNNVSTFSPFGSSVFTPDGNGGYTLNTGLGPQTQPVFNAQTNLAAILAGTAGNKAAKLADGIQFTGPSIASGIAGDQMNDYQLPQSLNFGGLNPIPTSGTDFSKAVTGAQKAAYDTQAGFLDPQFAQRRSDLTQQLADQGISPGTQAYGRAQGDLGRESDLAYRQAQDAAVTAGDAEQARLYGEDLSSRQQGAQEAEAQGQFGAATNQQRFNQGATNVQLNNAARQQAFDEAQAQFQAPIAALTGLAPLMDFSGTGTVPTTIGNTTVSPANIVQAGQVAANNAANRFNAQNTNFQTLTNGIGSLGGALGFGNGGLGSALGLTGAGGLFGPAAGAAADFGAGGAGSFFTGLGAADAGSLGIDPVAASLLGFV